MRLADVAHTYPYSPRHRTQREYERRPFSRLAQRASDGQCRHCAEAAATPQEARSQVLRQRVALSSSDLESWPFDAHIERAKRTSTALVREGYTRRRSTVLLDVEVRRRHVRHELAGPTVSRAGDAEGTRARTATDALPASINGADHLERMCISNADPNLPAAATRTFEERSSSLPRAE